VRFDALGTECAEISVTLLRQSQFTGENKIFLSAAAISSTQPEKRAFRFVKNNASIVVGEILSDGVSLSSLHHPKKFEVCFIVPER